MKFGLKYLLVGLLLLIFSTVAYSEPFLVCDPQTGVTDYELDFPLQGVKETTTAQPDGSLKFDLGTWVHGHGWFNGQAKAGVTYEVLDETTGETTTAQDWSDPAPFKLKIPNKKSASGWRITAN
jgi:hypothetical protein